MKFSARWVSKRWIAGSIATYARVHLSGALRKTYVQLNVINLFNQHYFGNLSTSINAYGFNASAPRLTPGPPRTVMGSLNIEC